jgi:hypothetical protein
MRIKYQSIRPIKTADGEWKFEVVGVPFGGHLNGKDAQGEFFTEQTDIMLNVGDERPVIYFHGSLPSGQIDPTPTPIGKAVYVGVREGVGHIFEVVLDKAKKFAERVRNSAIMGLARASGGSVPHLVRRNDKTGELYTWPLAELTLFDKGQGRLPANELATVSLKTVYDEAEMEIPENFIEEVKDLEMELAEEMEVDLEPEDNIELATVIATVLDASKRSK